MVVAVDKATVVPVKSGEATVVVDREGDDESKVTLEVPLRPERGTVRSRDRSGRRPPVNESVPWSFG